MMDSAQKNTNISQFIEIDSVFKPRLLPPINSSSTPLLASSPPPLSSSQPISNGAEENKENSDI